jgi:geranylgeranyl diphosphate synthase type I
LLTFLPIVHTTAIYLDDPPTPPAHADLVRARRIARYKSGKYTIERPLHVGAALAGAGPALRAELSGYGDPLGEAFQLRDDLLGAFGDEAITGKPVGDDLREGKPTPLLAIAISRADDDQAAVLDLVGAPDLDHSQVAAVQAVLVNTGAMAEIELTIDRLTNEAISAIEAAQVTEEARAALVELAHYVAWRDR